jgi:hypothetical protein
MDVLEGRADAPEMGVLIPLLFWAGAIFVAHKIGEIKNRTGWAWGLFLGWIGVIILACLSPRST